MFGVRNHKFFSLAAIVLIPSRVSSIATATSVILISLLTACETSGDMPLEKTQVSDSNNGVTYNTQPAWSHNGNFIAFRKIQERDKTSTSSIWVMKADGSDKTNITSDYQGLSGGPVWSPDSQWIAFVSDRSGNLDVWIVSVDGTSSTNLTADNSGADGPPIWAPNGRYIAFESSLSDTPRNDIRVTEISTMNTNNVTQDGIHSYLSPTWSPDSLSLAFVGRIAASNPIDAVPVGVWTASIGSETLHNLTTTEQYFTNVSWSPIGDYLATVIQDGANFDIWIMNPDGTDLRNLTLNHAEAAIRPVWSPDGKRIAFYSRHDENLDIWSINVDGTNLQNLTSSNMGRDEFPTWSPDGSKIAFEASSDLIGDSDIWLMNSDGSNLINLTGGE